MADPLKLAELIATHEVAAITPGGDSWLTKEQRALIAKALRSSLAPEERTTCPYMEDLRAYLLAHERDIYHGINDFFELTQVFINVIGRKPEKK